jgi:hypothetical protein
MMLSPTDKVGKYRVYDEGGGGRKGRGVHLNGNWNMDFLLPPKWSQNVSNFPTGRRGEAQVVAKKEQRFVPPPPKKCHFHSCRMNSIKKTPAAGGRPGENGISPNLAFFHTPTFPVQSKNKANNAYLQYYVNSEKRLCRKKDRRADVDFFKMGKD